MKNILARRSIRRYTDKPVPQELIEQILRAGMAAPSAQDQYCWRFIVINDKKILKSIPKIQPYANMLNHAQTAIAVCGDLRNLQERPKRFWVQDCSAATENMLIAIEALGLGGVWIGIYPIEDRVEGMKKLLKLPDGVVTLSVIALGYKAENKKPIDRYDADKVYWNAWGNLNH